MIYSEPSVLKDYIVNIINYMEITRSVILIYILELTKRKNIRRHCSFQDAHEIITQFFQTGLQYDIKDFLRFLCLCLSLDQWNGTFCFLFLVASEQGKQSM